MKSKKDNYLDDDLILQKIGAKIKALRKGENEPLTYVKFAEEIGVSKNAYNRLENGKSNFKIFLLLRVLKRHRISLEDFFSDL